MKKLVTMLFLLILILKSNNLHSQFSHLNNINKCRLVLINYGGEAEKLKNYLPDRSDLISMLQNQIPEIDFTYEGTEGQSVIYIQLGINLYKGDYDYYNKQYFGGLTFQVSRFYSCIPTSYSTSVIIYYDLNYVLYNNSDKEKINADVKEVIQTFITNFALQYYKEN